MQPTNKAAEQALRGIVLKRKISGPTRSRRGDEFIDYMRGAMIAWIDKTAHPSLVPAPVPTG